jgi:hypothetical protein
MYPSFIGFIESNVILKSLFGWLFPKIGIYAVIRNI